jgi:hypothetical protein
MSRRKVVENHAEAHRPVIDQKADKERSAEPSDEHTFCESEDALLASKRICKPLPDSQPVTLDDWHRALGFHKCATCGTPIGNGIRFVWQGRTRWCEECFWGDDSQSAISDVPTDFGAPEKENADVDH